MRSVLITQTIVVVAAVIGMVVWLGYASLPGALYGAAIALINTLLLVWRHAQGRRPRHADPGRHLWSFYRSMLERYLVVGVLFALGFGVLGLAPLPMLITFIAGQLALVLSGLTLKRD